MSKNNGPVVLLLDIETAPIIGHVWGLWENNVGLNQIESDWHLLSWSAKYLESKDKKIVYGPHRKVMYKDQRGVKNMENDKKLLQGIWDLIDSADIVITQNGISFDMKKLNARFVLNGMTPPSPVKHIDTKRIASRVFAFTSNKLEYMTSKLCAKHQKLKHKKFPGHELWKACLADNVEAWNEMKAYNEADVTSLEELYHVLAPWDNSAPDFNIYTDDNSEINCNCGSNNLQRRGTYKTTTGVYQRFVCKDCGKWTRNKKNMLTKAKRELLKGKV